MLVLVPTHTCGILRCPLVSVLGPVVSLVHDVGCIEVMSGTGIYGRTCYKLLWALALLVIIILSILSRLVTAWVNGMIMLTAGANG